MANEIPQQIGPYLIDEVLGAGGMGTVYLARHEQTGNQVAVKVLSAALAREPGFLARFNREIDALEKLEGPHIVRLIEHGVSDETYYYVMEYVSGETLAQRLQRVKRLSWRESIEIGVQICKALKTAHNAGIIHRDLKPSNLLIEPDGTVKLTDFGVAQIFATSRLTRTGGVIGTPEYMSPEQSQGRRVTRQSDIYSLGAVMYVMLTGRPPFTGRATMEIVRKHSFNQFDSPRSIVSEIPHWLDEIVCKCLEKKPEDRYPDAYVLSLRLAEVPRKVDLSQQSAEKSAPLESDTAAETLPGESASPAPGEVGGTLMRDLMRAHVDEAAAGSRWSRLFDNVWILIGLFLLLIVGTFTWYRAQQPDPHDLYERGQTLMQEPMGTAWEKAQQECFEPLLELDPEQWEPRLQPYLTQLELFELQQSFARSRERLLRRKPQNEVERFVLEALQHETEGEWTQTDEVLDSLMELLGDAPEREPERQFVTQLHSQLREERYRDNASFPLVEAALERADALAAAGETHQARQIWQSIVTLYDTDPGAAPYVDVAAERLDAEQDLLTKP
ncbi:Serine/threonine-protein kinase StkP [Maioricimonas rarisocia]|uniref:non-specific serine/threonine protein kinase n=1 Tax=Maioricimonas rarisocia TaxID=2528026 RepID=A0A517Z8Z3_9PLAN|nr:serine/threonine-protein kinase [Maioricimonas rarisocia]QDU38958.1 Serine/threonine-protein kinase StkP [Maioricimonas rarisocia]